DLHGHRRTGRRAGRPEHILPTHHDLHRMAAFARQHEGHRLDINEGLAAEPAADLCWIDPKVAEFHAEQLCSVGPHDEVALARAPELALPVGVAAGHATLRLDIGLMDG